MVGEGLEDYSRFETEREEMKIPKKEPPAILTLPTERDKASDKLSDYVIFLYGREKIGKSQFANQFPDAFFMKCEEGTKAMDVYARSVRTWQQYLGYLSLLEKTTRFGTVVHDTLDYLYNFCEAYTCEKLAIAHPGDEAFSKGWDFLKQQFRSAINRITASRRGTIFISHDDERTIKKRGEEQDRTQPSCKKGAMQVVGALADINAYAYYRPDGSRWIRIVGDESQYGGHRIAGHFVGIEEIPMGKNAKEAYDNFVAAFNTTEAKLPPKGGIAGEKKKIVVIKK